MRCFYYLFLVVPLLCLSCGRREAPGGEVVVYTSVDEPFSRPILTGFTRQTGIHVRTLFDTEAAKTVGLARRLVSERKSPRCDVFWNNEILQTVMLKNKGLLASYISEETGESPSLRGPGDFYTRQGGRLRVFLVRSTEFEKGRIPDSMEDLKDPAYSGRGAMAMPLAGTSLTHAVSLFLIKGAEEAESFFKAVLENEIKVVSGNATAKDLVVEGEADFCLTDTDDALKGMASDSALEIIVPDQGTGQMGAMLIPGSIALLKNAPHPEQGKRLIDFLLSRSNIRRMLSDGAFQVPLRKEVEPGENGYRPDDIRTMQVDWEKLYSIMPEARKVLMKLFLR